MRFGMRTFILTRRAVRDTDVPLSGHSVASRSHYFTTTPVLCTP